MSAQPAVGFISPPDWFDPTPDEFRDLSGGTVAVQQSFLDLPDFDWRMQSIARSEPEITKAARQLAGAGCSILAIVGTPFGWAGLDNIAEARHRMRRIEQACGVECISAGTAIIDALDDCQARRIALACTYYADEWRDLWSRFVARSGYDVAAAVTLSDQGLTPRHGPDSQEYWAPTPEDIVQSVEKIAHEFEMIEAIVITGAGSRTHAITQDLLTASGTHVIASDTVLYRKLFKKLKIDIPSYSLDI